MGKRYGDWEGTGDDFGRGGQGIVVRVKDRTGRHQGEHALKQVINPKRRDRFLDEVAAIKLLDHPNIIKLVDHSALDALPQEKEKQYIVMPIAAGGDLSDAADSFKGDVDRVLSVALQIAEGLQAAHAKNVIHRDLKPENILLTGTGEIWLSDFGICLIRDGRPRNTETGEVVGPVIFMAPELEGGGELEVEKDADIYSLGKVIYYLLTGGVRLPREELADDRYAEVLAQPGLEDLRLLLTQMICYRPQRIKTIAIVIERLKQIQQRRQGAPTGLTSKGIEALDRLKSEIADEQLRYQREIDAASREADLMDAAHASVKATIKVQLEAAAADFRTPGAIIAEVHEIGPPSDRNLQTRAARSQILDGLEVVYQKEPSSTGRVFALQFYVYRKIVVSLAGGAPKLGVILRLELREPGGRRVTNCVAYLGRRSAGRNRYEYFVTRDKPQTMEAEPGDWGGAMDGLKQFVTETVSAFPELIRKDYRQFVEMDFTRKR